MEHARPTARSGGSGGGGSGGGGGGGGGGSGMRRGGGFRFRDRSVLLQYIRKILGVITFHKNLC